jgi:hypothetical protein
MRFQAIPYCINRNDASDQYGNAERNQTEKRVFAVGRADVKAWGGAGATETLTPTDPRTEDRCLTIGQRVDYATDKAWLGQLYYPATGWDGTGEWYFTGAAVTMLLTAPYLSKVASNANVAMSPPTLVSAGTSSGSISTDVTLPDTPVGMTGVAELRQDTPYDGSRGATVVVWGFDTQISRPLQGERAGSYSRLTYTGSQSSTETQAGVALDYSGSNTKYWDSRSEHYTIQAQWVPMADAPTSTYTYMGMGATTTDIFYAVPPGDIHPRRNKTERYVSGGGHYPDSYHSRDYEVQTAAFSVSTPLFDLVSVSIYRESSSGQLVELSPNMTYYPPYFAPYYYHETGMGAAGRVELNYDYNPGSDTFPVGDTYKQNPSPPPNQLPAVIAEVEALRTAMRDAHMAAIYYDDESSSGYTERPYGGGSFYYASVNPSVDLLSQTLEWSTKDLILHDTTNDVYISIDGAFSGIDTAATLTVTLTVQTRHHTNTVTLAQRNYTYTELLLESEIGTTGKYAVPSPQIRAIFAPLYQEQGSFNGAHYVTQDEEGNGATPFHGFDFLLYLRSYGDIGTLNAENEIWRSGLFRAVQPAGNALRDRVQPGVSESARRATLSPTRRDSTTSWVLCFPTRFESVSETEYHRCGQTHSALISPRHRQSHCTGHRTWLIFSIPSLTVSPRSPSIPEDCSLRQAPRQSRWRSSWSTSASNWRKPEQPTSTPQSLR